jgi:hypothetical protein
MANQLLSRDLEILKGAWLIFLSLEGMVDQFKNFLVFLKILMIDIEILQVLRGLRSLWGCDGLSIQFHYSSLG